MSPGPCSAGLGCGGRVPLAAVQAPTRSWAASHHHRWQPLCRVAVQRVARASCEAALSRLAEVVVATLPPRWLCSHQSPSVLVPALRTVGNIVTGDDMQTQVVPAAPRQLTLLPSSCARVTLDCRTTLLRAMLGGASSWETLLPSA